ncbi:uncharacterized protein VDAG_07198 [Verticillium dahliae VdLs.17]|uniref:Uncharacterized protein n=1 Tax=Verticillium dahliae (strain VdLs.17 / ATCC MYA-4575 / FGSC 10137) TaxID=498257 RepID=G2XB60_VERDV|nr:uncharacterized protein VDAG_07198 [Verticillium dahliae VdLs.17]EGY16034.1 hypothetical protein VDAG_07198 [Verticillium dahliae VdLs.17]
MSANHRGYSSNFRGRGANRGRYGWRRGPSMPLASPTPSYPPLPLGPEIACVSIAKLAKDDAIPIEKARVSDCQLVASYNWLDKPKPTIIIPGLPPRWNPPSETPQLKEDSGVFYRDRNASRLPLHPMEPAIESILRTRPSFAAVSSTPIDIVACGSTLGNLLRFTSGDEKPFRMLVNVVGSTVHLIRREKSPNETIDDVRGYGHTFPDAYTTSDREARGSASHQRILSYCFGGLRSVLFVPECKSKSLEQIDLVFNQGVPLRRFESYKSVEVEFIEVEAKHDDETDPKHAGIFP